MRESSERMIAEISGFGLDSGEPLELASQIVNREEEFKSGEQRRHSIPGSRDLQNTDLQYQKENPSIGRKIV